MREKTFTLNINGYKYEMGYWAYPWIATAVGDLREGGVALNLRADDSIDLWIRADDDVWFEFDDPRDPEIPQHLTENQRHQLMDIFDGDTDYGYRVLDLGDGCGDPIFHEWDDPKFNKRGTTPPESK